MATMEIEWNSVKELLIEGKTKKVFSLEDKDLCLIVSKDRITAGDGVKSHEMIGKSIISTQTNCAIFEFLKASGIPTHFVSKVKENSFADWEKAFVAQRCEMIPIEWVARRVATGSFLKRNPNVEEGFKFTPLKLEHFFKDDANHDPFWSEESIICAKMKLKSVLITEMKVKEMLLITRLVFEVLERVWSQMNYVLIDMKIEFGINNEGTILLSDVIDNDSWRLWPEGDKSEMLDKQLYRNLSSNVSEEDLNNVKNKFSFVAEKTKQLFSQVLALKSKIAIILGSNSDLKFGEEIKKILDKKFGIKDVIIEVSSAHKSTENTLLVIEKLKQMNELKAIIAVAGLSNGLGPVISGNCALPVINCPPITDPQILSLDLWSSIRMPSEMGCSLVLGAQNAAQAVALIVGNDNPMVWSRIRTNQTLNIIKS